MILVPLTTHHSPLTTHHSPLTTHLLRLTLPAASRIARRHSTSVRNSRRAHGLEGVAIEDHRKHALHFGRRPRLAHLSAHEFRSCPPHVDRTNRVAVSRR